MNRCLLLLLIGCGWQEMADPVPGAEACWVRGGGVVCRWPDPPPPAPAEPAAWAVDACRRICQPSLPVVVPSARPEDGGWRCLCDHTAPEVLE